MSLVLTHTLHSAQLLFISPSLLNSKQQFSQVKKREQSLQLYIVVNIMQNRWLPHTCRTDASKTFTNLVALHPAWET